MQTRHTHSIVSIKMQEKGAGAVIALRMCGPVTLTKDEARKWCKQETDIGRKTSSVFCCSCSTLLTSIDGSNATTVASPCRLLARFWFINSIALTKWTLGQNLWLDRHFLLICFWHTENLRWYLQCLGNFQLLSQTKRFDNVFNHIHWVHASKFGSKINSIKHIVIAFCVAIKYLAICITKVCRISSKHFCFIIVLVVKHVKRVASKLLCSLQ